MHGLKQPLIKRTGNPPPTLARTYAYAHVHLPSARHVGDVPFGSIDMVMRSSSDMRHVLKLASGAFSPTTTNHRRAIISDIDENDSNQNGDHAQGSIDEAE